jgi:hypothetical protein
MPAYNTVAGPRVALYPWTSISVVDNAAADSGILTTKQLAIGPDSSGSDQLTVTNTTDQLATVQSAATDTASQYEPYSPGLYQDVAVTIPSGTSVSFPFNARWIRFVFATAPTVGSLIVTR